jgi:Transposase DDE domain
MSYYAPTDEGSTDARSRRTNGIDVQLRHAGGARSGGSSAASDSPHYRASARAPVASVRHVVCEFRSTFDSARETNATHQSTTDPDARLYKKARGRAARLGYLGHILMEHRSGLIVKATVTPADGYGERDAALRMVGDMPVGPRITVAGDKGYDTRDFVANLRAMRVTPHVAQYRETAHRGSAIDGRTTRHAGYAVSQRKRKLVEQGFGWMKTVGGLRKLRHRGGHLVTWMFTLPRRRTTSFGCAGCCRRWHNGPGSTLMNTLHASDSAGVMRSADAVCSTEKSFDNRISICPAME